MTFEEFKEQYPTPEDVIQFANENEVSVPDYVYTYSQLEDRVWDDARDWFYDEGLEGVIRYLNSISEQLNLSDPNVDELLFVLDDYDGEWYLAASEYDQIAQEIYDTAVEYGYFDDDIEGTETENDNENEVSSPTNIYSRIVDDGTVEEPLSLDEMISLPFNGVC